MQIGDMLYEGKAKKVFFTDDPQLFVIDFKDDATAFNGEKRGTIFGKGTLNNRISSFFFELLSRNGIVTHYVRRLSDTQMLVYGLDIIKIEVVVRNVAAGSLSKRLGLPEGTELEQPVVEFYYKDDSLGDPLINNYHAKVLGLATDEQLIRLAESGLEVNSILREHLATRGLELIDYKLEYGLHDGVLMLGDEISPDTCRLWDSASKEKLDKDRFRRDLGGVEEAYQEIAKRLGV